MQQRQKLSAKTAKKFALKNYGSSGATSGLSSSLAFTPIQASGAPGGGRGPGAALLPHAGAQGLPGP